MQSAEIRQSFLNFFSGRGHQVLPSSSLIPHNDPSVLLTTAGMQQFKAFYAGLAEPPAKKVATTQKCFRTVDLDEVGDYSHLTFFEMLGNFSFGDYFKEGAIEMAWEYLTAELRLDPARLWPSVYPDDPEARQTWRRVCGREPYPLEDNYWPSSLEGWVGPCGPDSEIYWDMGAGMGCGQPDCHPGHCERYMELWNLVFPQYNRQPGGAMLPLDPPGIDTGMGLERLSVVLNGLDSIHQTDIFGALNHHFRQRSTLGNPDSDAAAYARRLLSDHSRATAFLVADGVRPSNEGRGYVLRKMVRRATLHGVRRLGISDGLSGSVELVGELMGDAYPEILQRSADVARVLAGEEAAFRRTLEQGESAFEDVVRRSGHLVAGADAFKLHDTFGFPIELTVELAAERGLKVDRQGFEAALADARQLSRRHKRRQATPRSGLPASRFTGYESMTGGGRVLKLFRGDQEVDRASEGDEVEVYLDATPMYAESGGQVGDTGVLEGPQGTLEIRDVQKQGEAFAHYARVVEGSIMVGDEVRAEVDAEARWATMRHHSATHLVHRALREVLGDGATQAGSYVAPETCTFDFSLDRAVSRAELDAVFGIVNRSIREDWARVTRVMPLAEARQSGAMQLFGEKYGDEVRVVSFGEFSVELCGGTHVERTGQIGQVVPVSERSVGSGLRRVEFLAGEASERHLRALVGSVEKAALALMVSPADLPARVEALVDERKALQRQIEDLQRRLVAGGGGPAHGFRNGVVFQVVSAKDPDLIRHAADRLLDLESTSQLAVVMAGADGSARLVVKARRGGDATAAEAFARVREQVGGRGGGNETLAQGGGFKTSDLDAVVDAAAGLLMERGADQDPGGQT
ncbi:MAG TPA: alanine--tRNA ligase [Candidatus Dormibacteraeota bacterium]|nr:alanine--tRNA ligase [Candidatus Dormibacteraeota bacterium]